jgi:peptidoglycan L-alanyl-D-glutamate endopeptidase CwlK
MDAITLQRIETAHPKIREELKDLYIKANNKLGKGVRLRFAWVFRTPQEQNALFTKKPKVTNAQAWQSIHNYGLAFDIVLLYDNDGNGTFEEASWNTKRDGDKDNIADWLEVTKVFTDAGYTNGFLKNGKKWDLPHFQKDFGYKWRDLKKLIDSGKTIESNGIIYPKI